GRDPAINPVYMGDYDQVVADNSNAYMTWGDNRLMHLGRNNPDVRFARLNLGMAVVSSVPGEGDVLTTQPPRFAVTFSDPYDPKSVQADAFTVNNVVADSVEQTSASTLTFVFQVSPVTMQGLQHMNLAGGVIRRLSDGDANQPFASTFRYAVTRQM